MAASDATSGCVNAEGGGIAQKRHVLEQLLARTLFITHGRCAAFCGPKHSVAIAFHMLSQPMPLRAPSSPASNIVLYRGAPSSELVPHCAATSRRRKCFNGETITHGATS